MKKTPPPPAPDKAFSEAFDQNEAAFFRNLATSVPYAVFGAELGISATHYGRLAKLLVNDLYFQKDDGEVGEELGIEAFRVDKLRKDEAYPRLEALILRKMERYSKPKTFGEELIQPERQLRALMEAENLAYLGINERVKSDQTESMADRLMPSLTKQNIEERTEKSYKIDVKLLMRAVREEPGLLKELLPEDQVKQLVAGVIEGEVIEEDA